MATYANADAEHIAHGIRLGGKSAELDTALRDATHPLNADDLEHLIHPDFRETYSNQPTAREGGFERLGMLKLAHPGDVPGWLMAAEWFGWLPGIYASREAVLVAYGYVLGGEAGGYLDELQVQVRRREGREITVEDIEAFAGRKPSS